MLRLLRILDGIGRDVRDGLGLDPADADWTLIFELHDGPKPGVTYLSVTTLRVN